MSVLIIKEKSKNLTDLNYVEGEIVGVTFINHKGSKKRSTSSVLVLSIRGSQEKFGFVESSNGYRTMSDMMLVGRNAKLYYDSSGKRIEFNVTLHILDLTIGNYKAIDFSKNRYSGWPIALIFFSGTLIILIVIIFFVKEFKKKVKESITSNSILPYL